MSKHKPSLYVNKVLRVVINVECSVDTKAMRLLEIFDFRQFPIAESQKFSTVETGPKENRGFERPKVSRNLPKIFPKMLTENTFRK